jgi:hypothetical protein
MSARARQVRYKSTDEVLDAVFALPSDPEESEDDQDGVSGDGDASIDDRESITLSDDGDDDNDDDVRYRLPSDSDDSDVCSSSSSTEDTDSDNSEEDSNGWTKTVPTNGSVDFDKVTVVPQHPFVPEEGAADFFGKFFDENLYNWLVNQTNLYAQQNNTRHWEAVTSDELKAFVGILIAIGLHQVPTIDLCWSSDPLFRIQPVANVMAVKRFKKIREVLHANDNSRAPKRGDPQYDKLFKVRPVLQQLNATFLEQAVASTSQSIDEAMIKFKGRSSIKQYMPMKPVKRGYKVWVRSDSRTGYIYEFDIYTGKDDGGQVSLGLGANVVMKLCRALTGSGSHVTFDNFFTSFELMEKLFDDKIYSTGTVRSNRKDLPVIAREQISLSKGNYEARAKQHTSYIRWKDTKDVHILTTAFNPANCGTVKRTQKDGSITQVSCPEVVYEYTKRMGGVDRFDERRGRYNVSRRSRRWWMRIFYFLVDSSIVNALILFNSVRPDDHVSMLQFREQLFRELVGSFTSRCRRSSLDGGQYIRRRTKHSALPSKPFGVPNAIRFKSVGIHMPESISSFRRCRYCSSRKNNKRSRIACSTCGVALCITPCFRDFHQ